MLLNLAEIMGHVGRHRKVYTAAVAGVLVAKRIDARLVHVVDWDKKTAHAFELTDDLLDFLHMKGLEEEFKSYHAKRTQELS